MIFLSLPYKNLVFSGGGVLGIAYLGVLDYLYKINLPPQILRVAGTSAGAITACLTSFNLSFDDLKEIADSLDYNKVPGKDDVSVDSKSPPRYFTQSIKSHLDNIFGNAECVYRLITQFGWYSSSYLYEWIKEQIASQFNSDLKSPPYTFSDFKNTAIHKNEIPFKDLYIVGTDSSKSTSIIFSYEFTPNMEVAEAVRISMSVPLLFEAIKSSPFSSSKDSPQVYVDGGLLYNYPINIFDSLSPQKETLGTYFKNALPPASINNLVDFISSTISCATRLQALLFQENKSNLARSIPIFTSDIQPMNFNITVGDPTYLFLYEQGYLGTEVFFSLLS